MERFWSKVDKTDGCWNWTASKFNNSGYGLIKIAGKRRSAHRVSFELFHGAIPSGMLICHRCDNRACVNPDHLFLGTHRDNMDDMVAKDRQPRGKKNGRARLDEETVVAARYAQLTSGASVATIARSLGVSKSTAHRALTGENWSRA